MKKTIRLTESDLHNMIAEAVKTALNEIGDTDAGQYLMGRAAARSSRVGDHDTAREIHQAALKNWTPSQKSSAMRGASDYNPYLEGSQSQNKYMGYVDDAERLHDYGSSCVAYGEKLRMQNRAKQLRDQGNPTIQKQNLRKQKKKY